VSHKSAGQHTNGDLAHNLIAIFRRHAPTMQFFAPSDCSNCHQNLATTSAIVLSHISIHNRTPYLHCRLQSAHRSTHSSIRKLV